MSLSIHIYPYLKNSYTKLFIHVKLRQRLPCGGLFDPKTQAEFLVTKYNELEEVKAID